MRVDNMREVILGLQAQLGERMRELQAAAVSMETDMREKMMLQESCAFASMKSSSGLHHSASLFGFDWYESQVVNCKPRLTRSNDN
jgi:hypothetical protein